MEKKYDKTNLISGKIFLRKLDARLIYNLANYKKFMITAMKFLNKKIIKYCYYNCYQ